MKKKRKTKNEKVEKRDEETISGYGGLSRFLLFMIIFVQYLNHLLFDSG
jgi:hypothetical protein